MGVTGVGSVDWTDTELKRRHFIPTIVKGVSPQSYFALLDVRNRIHLGPGYSGECWSISVVTFKTGGWFMTVITCTL